MMKQTATAPIQGANNGNTPGPWFAEHGTPSGRRVVADLVEGKASLVHYRIVHEGQEEGGGEADARLIAQAPAMAALLRERLTLEANRHRCTGRSATCWWCDAKRVLEEVRQ